MRAQVNYRTPRDVLQQIAMLVHPGVRVESASSLAGDGIDIATYRDFNELKTATVAAIDTARRQGFANGDIVVLTYCGRERSALMPFDFETMDDRVMRRLYVGATRASMKLAFVMSERAAARLLAAAE